MRNVVKVLGTGLLLAAVTACGANSGNAGSPPSSSVATSSAPSGVTTVVPAPPQSGTGTGRPTQGVPPGDKAIGESQVDAKSLPEGYPRSLFLGDDGRSLVLQAEEGGCRRVSARVGDQTAQQVVVFVAVANAPKGQMCPDYLREITIPLTLAAPLGTRTVVLRQG